MTIIVVRDEAGREDVARSTACRTAAVTAGSAVDRAVAHPRQWRG